MVLYRQHEMDRFFNDYGLQPPVNIPQFGRMLVRPNQKGIQSLCSRFFNAGNISVIYGRANCGKTPLHFSLATALSSGCNLDNIHTVCSEPQSCLIVSGEMNDNQWAKIKSWNEKIFPKRDVSAFVEIANYPWKLDSTEGQQFFEDLVRRVNAGHVGQRPVSVLIFDSIKTLTSAGDNSSKWNVLFNFLNMLRERHGWTIIVIHHTHKGKDDDSFGTYDIDVKVDNKIYVGKDFAKACKKLEGVERWLPPEGDKESTQAYFASIKKMTDGMLKGKYADSIWFYLALEKGRDFKTSDKLPVLMRMLPEDEKPEWTVADILSDESPYSWSAFSGHRQNTKDNMDSAPHEAESVPLNDTKEEAPQEERKPTYKELLAAHDRDLVLRWFRKAYAGGCMTRPMLADWLGCKKPNIDNLMNNDYYAPIREEDWKD